MVTHHQVHFTAVPDPFPVPEVKCQVQDRHTGKKNGSPGSRTNSPKPHFQTLDTSQTKCVEEMQGKVYRLLGETPPNGGEFAKSVKRILGREEAWNRY